MYFFVYFTKLGSYSIYHRVACCFHLMLHRELSRASLSRLLHAVLNGCIVVALGSGLKWRQEQACMTEALGEPPPLHTHDRRPGQAQGGRPRLLSLLGQ